MLNLLNEYQARRRRKAQLSERFTAVHDNNLWGSNESRSGAGSARNAPSVVVAGQAIRRAVGENPIVTLSDIPCGDFNWMPDVLGALEGVRYTGFDIVFSALQNNKDRFPQYDFRVLDIVTTVPPRADLILCKDLMNHLSDDDIKSCIANMKKSGSTFLLASNNPGFVNTALPDNLQGSRFLDITAAPFGYNPPLWTQEGYMSLWRLQDMGDCKF